MDGVAQTVEHWTANLATQVRSPVGEEPSDLIWALLHVQMKSNFARLSVCNCRLTGKWCGTIKAVGNTDHTRQTWIHMQTPLSPLVGCGPVAICWQRALCYAPLFPSAIGPMSRFLKNHEEGIVKHIIFNHTLSYDNITLNLFHIWLICGNSANNTVVITRIICCGWRRNLV